MTKSFSPTSPVASSARGLYRSVAPTKQKGAVKGQPLVLPASIAQLPVSGSPFSTSNALDLKTGLQKSAEGGTRTPTGCPTTPSRWRVYQIPPLRRHERMSQREASKGSYLPRRPTTAPAASLFLHSVALVSQLSRCPRMRLVGWVPSVRLQMASSPGPM